jgi:hypothetical protein
MRAAKDDAVRPDAKAAESLAAGAVTLVDVVELMNKRCHLGALWVTTQLRVVQRMLGRMLCAKSRA